MRQDEPGCPVTEGQWGSGKSEQLRDVKMTLVGIDLWRKFHNVDTEMIITKLGRNMFPVLTVEVSGLEPEARYFVLMEVCLSSDRRYKFVGAEWKAAGKAEPQLPSNTRLFVHQDSPATGTHWMREPIKMKSAKLTNNPLNRSGHVVLTSMHKYIPRIHVVKTSDIMALSWSPTATFMFPETEFIAVTAYQFDVFSYFRMKEVTTLKINNNPFAKGFRENGLSYVKRKQNETVSSRKRRCHEKISLSSVGSDQSASPPVAEESNNNDQNTERVSLVTQDQNESNSVPSVDSPREDISTAVANISINTNSIQYPYSGIYHSYYQHQEQQMWRFPYLFPPPPPLLSPLLLPFPYHFSPFLHQFHHPAHSYITEMNPQPCDYSLREKTS